MSTRRLEQRLIAQGKEPKRLLATFLSFFHYYEDGGVDCYCSVDRGEVVDTCSALKTEELSENDVAQNSASRSSSQRQQIQ